ncbi:MAG: hypothetical protein LKF36_04950 [Lactobacillus sp.]|jgi:hypothetical protein|nr:hypothetical protein [Lactobacillus sp.]
MRKKLSRKALKQASLKKIYFYIEFSDGRVLEMPVQISKTDTSAKDALIARLQKREGFATDTQGVRYEFKNMVHYEIIEDKK